MKMDLNNWLGLISFVLTIVALCFLGIPNKWCYGFFTVSMIIQGIVFHRTKQWWLMVQMAVLIIFNVINYIRWTSQGIG